MEEFPFRRISWLCKPKVSTFPYCFNFSSGPRRWATLSVHGGGEQTTVQHAAAAVFITTNWSSTAPLPPRSTWSLPSPLDSKSGPKLPTHFSLFCILLTRQVGTGGPLCTTWKLWGPQRCPVPPLQVPSANTRCPRRVGVVHGWGSLTDVSLPPSPW